jgi:CRP-like cAMP-binding protein
MGFPLFEGFTEYGIGRVLEAGRVAAHPAGHVVFREGEDPGHVVLLIAGMLEVYVERKGEEIGITTIVPGQIVGEISVLSEMPRSASVRAATAVTLCEWTCESFRKLLFGDAGFARRVFRDSLRSVIEAEKRLVEERAGAPTG